MTFIITVVCIRPLRRPIGTYSTILVELAEQDEGAWSRAGYVAGLSRYFESPVHGTAYHVLGEEGDGYKTSNMFFQYGEDDEPARLVVPAPWRVDCEALLTDLKSASSESQILFIAEDNGHVTAPDIGAEESETIDRIGPIDLPTFWGLVDLGNIFEDSLTVIV
jgi:hypothetical protein